MTIARVWLSGFLLLGALLGLLGSLIVVWQYHIDVEPHLIGLHFLALNAGYVIASTASQRALRYIAARTLAICACSLTCVSFILLIFVSPPAPAALRLAVLVAVGLSAGGLGTALLYGSERVFAQTPASATNRAGILFGSGCFLSTVIVGATFLSDSLLLEICLLATVSLIFLVAFIRTANSLEYRDPRILGQERLRETLGDLRSIATVLFSLLLFFQFGNEWALAGWLPVFLVHRLGSNPVLAIGVLALYFLSLTFGRLAAQPLLTRFNHQRLLIVSIACAMCGFLLLSFANSLAGATVAVVVIGIGFAPIYPLIAERLDARFSYHPGFYNGSISIAVTGAMSAPWLLGFVAASLGMQYVMLLPAFGSVIVLLLSLLLMFEAHLMEDKPSEKVRSAAGGR